MPINTRENAITNVIIGGGCAGYSLARQADRLKHGVTVMIMGNAKRQDHSWGFFLNDDTADAAKMVRKTWHQWQIITAKRSVTQTAIDHPYAGLESKAWISACKDAANAHGVKYSSAQVNNINGKVITTDQGQFTAEMVYDSRPIQPPQGMMIQSFIGHEVQTATPVFDPNTAILMDFRCDQSRGIHFIYILPYSDRQALIESTMFSPTIQPDAFYEDAIHTYLQEHLGVGQFMTLRREKGAIPMGILPKPAGPSVAIGGRGGAIRPSSGYAFSFIQKQITHILSDEPSMPHKPVDLFMDQIFLKVLRRRPDLAPILFSRMATALSGDEMARFMSGHATYLLRLKVILAMPKLPFLLALLSGRRHG